MIHPYEGLASPLKTVQPNEAWLCAGHGQGPHVSWAATAGPLVSAAVGAPSPGYRNS